MKKEFNLSPNFSKKLRNKKDIKFIVIHYTGMQSEIESLKRLKDPKSEVSCHYLINRKGQIKQMVTDSRIAWHAGKSKWKKFNNLNSNSIGIELVNRGHEWGYQNYTKTQIKNLIKLCRNLKKKYPESIINSFCPIGKNENPNNKNIPKVVTTENDNLIYISRSAIPQSKKDINNNIRISYQ